MAIVYKIIAAYLVVLAVLIGIHFIFAPLYQDTLDSVDGWRVLDWFIAVGVLVLWVFHYLRKREHDAADPDGQATRRYLEVNFALYGSLLIGILFFWNWIDFLVQDPDVQSNVNLMFWPYIDSALAVLLGVSGCQMWRE